MDAFCSWCALDLMSPRKKLLLRRRFWMPAAAAASDDSCTQASRAAACWRPSPGQVKQAICDAGNELLRWPPEAAAMPGVQRRQTPTNLQGAVPAEAGRAGGGGGGARGRVAARQGRAHMGALPAAALAAGDGPLAAQPDAFGRGGGDRHSGQHARPVRRVRRAVAAGHRGPCAPPAQRWDGIAGCAVTGAAAPARLRWQRCV